MSFEKGDKVRVKEDRLECYQVEFQRKVRGGRVGIVRGYPQPRREFDSPLVEFPAEGRKKHYAPGRIDKRDLEMVEQAKKDEVQP